MTDLTAAPRPVPTTEDRMRDARTDHTFATYLDATERNQLDARAACAEAERDEALDARNVLRTQLDTARAELGAAQELLAVVDDLAEQLDRARARYATRPEVTPQPASVPPRRAQEQPTVEAEEIARLWHNTLQKLRHGRLTGALLWQSLPQEERDLLAETAGELLVWLGRRAQEQPAAATGLPTGTDETLAWMRRHGLGHGAGVGAVLAAVRADLARS